MGNLKGIIDVEVTANKLQTTIKALLGRPITKVEALEALQLHRDGDGGNTVGWKFDEKVNNVMICSWKQHTVLGDALIDLGRLAHHYPELEWAFPERYRAYQQPER